MRRLTWPAFPSCEEQEGASRIFTPIRMRWPNEDKTMQAEQTRHSPREDFAKAIGNFARALNGAQRRPEDPCDGLHPEVLAEAISAARWAQNAFDARMIGYRVVVARFLANSAVASGDSGCAPSRPAQRSATAVATRPHMTTQAETTLNALRRLAPFERAALVLVSVERLPYEHAACVMDLTLQEFAEAVARAREAFAARLACTGAPGRGRASHLKLVG